MTRDAGVAKRGFERSTVTYGREDTCKGDVWDLEVVYISLESNLPDDCGILVRSQAMATCRKHSTNLQTVTGLVEI